MDATRLVLEGWSLDDAEVAALRARLREDPADREARAILLGTRFESEGGRDVSHVMWFIANEPRSHIAGTPFCHLPQSEDASAYAEGRSLWLQHVAETPEDIDILMNAAVFMWYDDPEESLDLLERANALSPGSWRVASALAQRIRSQARSGSDPVEGAARALALLESVQPNPDEESAWLMDIAVTAWEAGDIATTKSRATALLALDPADLGWMAGNVVHHGHRLLGLVALAGDDVAEATRRLLASADTDGSPQLNSFGPNMSLAAALLARGKTEAVLEYFDRCERFWAKASDHLPDWRSDVQAERDPDFGANLVY